MRQSATMVYLAASLSVAGRRLDVRDREEIPTVSPVNVRRAVPAFCWRVHGAGEGRNAFRIWLAATRAANRGWLSVAAWRDRKGVWVQGGFSVRASLPGDECTPSPKSMTITLIGY